MYSDSWVGIFTVFLHYEIDAVLHVFVIDAFRAFVVDSLTGLERLFVAPR